MRSAEEFLLQTPFSVSLDSKSPQATIHIFTEKEIASAASAEVAFAKAIYSELKPKNVYVASNDGQHFLIVFPQDTLKKLGQGTVGEEHLVTHWGGIVSTALQTSVFEKKELFL